MFIGRKKRGKWHIINVKFFKNIISKKRGGKRNEVELAKSSLGIIVQLLMSWFTTTSKNNKNSVCKLVPLFIKYYHIKNKTILSSFIKRLLYNYPHIYYIVTYVIIVSTEMRNWHAPWLIGINTIYVCWSKYYLIKIMNLFVKLKGNSYNFKVKIFHLKKSFNFIHVENW